MRRTLVGLVLIVSTTNLFSQDNSAKPIDPKRQQVYLVESVIVNGDTMPFFGLREVTIYAKATIDVKKLDYLTRSIIKAYPYAKITSETLAEMDIELAKIKTPRERRKYLNWAEDQLKSAFEKDLRKLTYSQGRILIKLVNRETGRTSYQLIKELKGGFSAFMWQGVAKLIGANLKSEFDPKKEDIFIEHIVNKIERGELPVAHLERKSVVRPITAAK